MKCPFTAATGVRIPLGTPPKKTGVDSQGFFALIDPPDATAGKSGSLLLPSRSAIARIDYAHLLLFCASSNGAAEASSLARFAFFV